MPVGDLRIISRNTQGVRLISLAKGDRLVSATIIAAEEEIEIPQDEDEGESVAQDSVESPEEDAGESPAQDPEEPASE